MRRRQFMMLSGFVALLELGGATAGAEQPAETLGVEMIELDGTTIRVLTLGLEDRGQRAPVVVFEAGATHSLDVWANVLPEVAASAAVVAYDRAGLGRSEWDGETPTPLHVSTRLRRLLKEVGAEPPYVLVGHSWGGVLARYFAGNHPSEMAGLVFVDPGPMITESPDEVLAPFEAVGAGKAGYDKFWSTYAALFEKAAPAVRAEFAVFRGLMEMDLADRGLRPAPEVPVVVIVAAKPYPAVLQLPYDQQAHFEADVRHRISVLSEWALGSPLGTLVMSNHMSHAVLREDPELVVWAIQRVLAAVPEGVEGRDGNVPGQKETGVEGTSPEQ